MQLFVLRESSLYMKEFIVNQAHSDEAEASIVGPIIILAIVVVLAVVVFGKLSASTERKGADIANCIASSTSFKKRASVTSTTCNDKNTSGHSYDTDKSDY